MAFDCLWVAGDELRDQGLDRRRERLEQVVKGQDLLLPARRLVRRIMNSFRVLRRR
jgi:ATP-dependent DNA ligase